MAGPATHCWVEHADDVLAGERPDRPPTPARQRIGGKHGSEVYACVSGPDSHAWIELLASCSESDVAHQETIRDMAAATARVWKQVTALQAMAGTIRLALQPAETVELVFDALVRATRFRGGIAIVQLPNERSFAKLDASGFSPVADRQLELLHETSEEVRAFDKKRDANDPLYAACVALMDPFEPTAVARLESPHGTLGYVLAVSDERPSSDDLKLLTGAARAIATHLDNAHELVRAGGRTAELPAVVATVTVEDERALSAREIATNFDGVLGGIVDSAELALGDAAGPEDVRTSLDRLLDGVKWARTMARNLLAAVREETPRRIHQDLGPHIATALDMFSGSLPSEIELHAAIETDGCKVVADAAQISQAIVSLCNNSREAIGQRHGRIYVLVDPVELGVRDAAQLAPSAAPGRYLRIAVSDTGPGVPETIRTHVFEPFVSTKAARAALGMGLTVVREVADAHGGYVRLSQAPEGGAQFEIYLPQAEEPARAPVSERPTERPQAQERVETEEPPLAAEPATGSDLVPVSAGGTSLSRGDAHEAEIIAPSSMKAWNPMALGTSSRAGSTASLANESRAAALTGPSSEDDAAGSSGSQRSALVPVATRPFAVAERRASAQQRASVVQSGDKPPENWAGTPASPRARSGAAAIGYERGGVIDVLAWTRAEVAAIDKPAGKDSGALPKPSAKSKSRTSGGYAPSDDVLDGSVDDAG